MPQLTDPVKQLTITSCASDPSGATGVQVRGTANNPSTTGATIFAFAVNIADPHNAQAGWAYPETVVVPPGQSEPWSYDSRPGERVSAGPSCSLSEVTSRTLAGAAGALPANSTVLLKSLRTALNTTVGTTATVEDPGWGVFPDSQGTLTARGQSGRYEATANYLATNLTCDAYLGTNCREMSLPDGSQVLTGQQRGCPGDGSVSYEVALARPDGVLIHLTLDNVSPTATDVVVCAANLGVDLPQANIFGSDVPGILGVALASGPKSSTSGPTPPLTMDQMVQIATALSW